LSRRIARASLYPPIMILEMNSTISQERERGLFPRQGEEDGRVLRLEPAN
jgi:hypothetical protein